MLVLKPRGSFRRMAPGLHKRIDLLTEGGVG
jgi:hypothetical protein